MSLLDSLRQRLKVIERKFAAAVTPMRELELGRDVLIRRRIDVLIYLLN